MPAAVTPRPLAADGSSYTDWAAIAVGAVLAAAVSIVMLTFGAALGLSISSPWPGEGVSLFWFAIAAGLWLLWVQVSSFLAGGYLAGRLRRRVADATVDETDFRDGAHGLAVWAVGSLIAALLTVGGITGAAQTATQAAGAAATGIAGLAEEADGDQAVGYFTDALFRTETAAPGERRPELRAEAGRILARSVTTGGLDAADRTQLARLIAAETALSEAEAEARVDETVQRVEAAVTEARALADEARRTGVIVGFLTAAALVVSAAAAWFAASLGGRHRDEGTLLPGWGRR
jgi:hypothetical protein